MDLRSAGFPAPFADEDMKRLLIDLGIVLAVLLVVAVVLFVLLFHEQIIGVLQCLAFC